MGVTGFGFRDLQHPDPHEAAAVQRAVADLLARTATPADVARWWNADGFKRRRSPHLPWTSAAVWQTLGSDRIAGIVRRGGHVVDAAPSWIPLITVAQHDALLALPREHDLRRDFGFNGYLARGVAWCGVCGGAMVHREGGAATKYVCQRRITNQLDGRPDVRRHPQILGRVLEEVLRERVLTLLAERGTRLLSYTPRSATDLAALIGRQRKTLEVHNSEFELDTPLRVQEAEHELAVLEAARDDRGLLDALTGLDTSSTTALAASWDLLTIKQRHTILRRTLHATVDTGVGASRVQVDDLMHD